MSGAPLLRVKRIREDASIPAYATERSAGLDLRAALDAELVLRPGGRAAVPTGLAFELPAGNEAQVRPRSGIALRCGVTVLNAPGTIDEDYRGEVRVLLVNHGDEDFVIHPGDRIAQLVVAPITRVECEAVEELGGTARGAGGFGSTGVGS